MRRRHAMPFGAEIRDEADTRFRLWAPAARGVELLLAHGKARRETEMTALDDGWFEACMAGALAGARYCFRIDGGVVVPDPASRSNPDDVHAASMVVDPLEFEWSDGAWKGRPWEEAIIYELHVGTFTTAGTFAAAIERLAYLADLGVTAIELMPVADFPGSRNWGYDGVLPFAPDSTYGPTDDLKRLIDAAHAHQLMVFLDVVYNHFGPEGNYLHAYAPQFFNPQHQTPWGAALNFDRAQSRTVREFFIHNALYWLEEYGCDGLRLDAVDRIVDESAPDLIVELSARVREGPGQTRHVHVVLENDRNEAHYLGRDAHHRALHATAQWNDDVHHALHVLVTGETGGYYADYADAPLHHFGRCLAEGFAYQGEPSRHRGGAARGEPSLQLPPAAFVAPLQTHDQVGNRAYGERIGHLADPRRLRAAIACVLLAPSPPLLFMGEEFAASTRFLFFCDFGPDLAAAVTQGRRREMGCLSRDRGVASDDAIPDPNDPATFARSKLDWNELDAAPHDAWLAFYRKCLRLRAEHIFPRLAGMAPSGSYSIERDEAMFVQWTLADGSQLHLIANFATTRPHRIDRPPGRLLYTTDAEQADPGVRTLRPGSMLCVLAVRA